MEKCPYCHALRPRYTYRTRPRFTYLAVECEVCHFTGREIPILGSSEASEVTAAFAAADAWNEDAKRQTAAKGPLVLH